MLDAGSVGYLIPSSSMAQRLSHDHTRPSEITILQPRHPHMDELSPPSSPSSTPPATPPANVPLIGASYTNRLPQSHKDLKVPQTHDSHYLLRTPSPGVYSTHATHETASKAHSRHTHTTHRSKSSKSKSRTGEDNISMLMRLMRTSQISESAEATIQNLMESLRVAVLDRNNARAEVISLQAQLTMYKWQMEQAQEEILRAQSIVNALVEERRIGEEREAKLRARAREAEAILRIRDAHQEGFQRGLHDAQKLAKQNLFSTHEPYGDVEVSKSTVGDGLKNSSSSHRSHNRRRSEPTVTSRKSTQQDNNTLALTVDPEPIPNQQATSPPVLRTRPRTSSLAAHITPFPLNAETAPPVPPLPRPHVHAVPPSRPPTRPPTRNESKVQSMPADRTPTPPPLAHSYQHDSFIPSMDSNGRFTLPPPHSMQRPVSTYTVSTTRATQEPQRREEITEPSSSSSSSPTSDETREEQHSPSFPFPRQIHPDVNAPPSKIRPQSLKSRASTRMSDYDLLAPVGRVPSQDSQSQRKVEEWRDALGFVPYIGPDNVAPSGIPPPPIIASDVQPNRPRLEHREKKEPSSCPVSPPRRKMSGSKEPPTTNGFAPSLNWLRNRFQTTRQESSATTIPKIDIEPPSQSASATSSAQTHVNRKLLTPEPPAYSTLHSDPLETPQETVTVSPYPNIPPPKIHREYAVAPSPEGFSHPKPSSRSGRKRGVTIGNGGHHNVDSSRGTTRRRAATVVSGETAPLNRPILLFNSPES